MALLVAEELKPSLNKQRPVQATVRPTDRPDGSHLSELSLFSIMMCSLWTIMMAGWLTTALLVLLAGAFSYSDGSRAHAKDYRCFVPIWFRSPGPAFSWHTDALLDLARRHCRGFGLVLMGPKGKQSPERLSQQEEDNIRITACFYPALYHYNCQGSWQPVGPGQGCRGSDPSEAEACGSPCMQLSAPVFSWCHSAYLGVF